MSSIGPQLPPHLTKRKRTPSDDHNQEAAAGGRSQPPSKTSRRMNEAEIDLKGDSDPNDGFGPSAATVGPTQSDPSVSAGKNKYPPVLHAISGPTQPPTSPPPRRTAAGPSMPPTQHTNSDSDSPSQREQSTRRILGPAAPPPAFLSERPPNPPSSSDEDSDDDYGPALPTSAQAAKRAAAAAAAVSARQAQDAESAPPSPPSKRDDWMLRPPPPTNKPDPTKIRAKGFATGRAVASTPQIPGEIGSLWTETAQERKDRILSRRGPDDPSSSAAAAGGIRGSSQPEDARDAAIRAYTCQVRGKSLFEEHQANRKAGGRARTAAADDDPSKRAFDREKDMAVGGRVTNAQIRDIRKQAADFGGRFSKGRYL